MSEQSNIDHSKKHPTHIAWHVRDGKNGGKAFWTRIGAAWITKDGKGYTLQLDCVPLDGRVVLRQPEQE